jgi:hypothetical protein
VEGAPSLCLYDDGMVDYHVDPLATESVALVVNIEPFLAFNDMPRSRSSISSAFEYMDSTRRNKLSVHGIEPADNDRVIFVALGRREGASHHSMGAVFTSVSNHSPCNHSAATSPKSSRQHLPYSAHCVVIDEQMPRMKQMGSGRGCSYTPSLKLIVLVSE